MHLSIHQCVQMNMNAYKYELLCTNTNKCTKIGINEYKYVKVIRCRYRSVPKKHKSDKIRMIAYKEL